MSVNESTRHAKSCLLDTVGSYTRDGANVLEKFTTIRKKCGCAVTSNASIKKRFKDFLLLKKTNLVFRQTWKKALLKCNGSP